MKQTFKIIISGGGTGGHIFPAISIANEVRGRCPDADILFVGADNRMEMERVPAAGYRIVGLPVSGFNRADLSKNVKVIARLVRSLRLADNIVREFKPDIAVGVGGYAAGPTLWSAAKRRIPTLIQEQNSYAGVTNKLLSKKAVRICVAYEGMERFFPADKIIITGNPVRKDLENLSGQKAEALAFWGFSPAQKTILVLGGSLGARTVNSSIIKHIDTLLASGMQLIWQTGRFYHAEIRNNMEKYKETSSIRCVEFITRMDYAYAAADLVVSRAGAGTISELCLLAKPSILVPSPNVAEDHQTKNAMALLKKDATILTPDGDADNMLVENILNTVADDNRLAALSANIAPLARHHSAERIVDEIISIVNNK
ncbi:MAG: undecaprenyldiphospho-muramoylpentapeptide beta-N-acetylglucosaminyltransferase [Tannerellaceae bacterium]|jgi:UDP-N-acetylglucosamine--N-acetylmuramyl-(pentapeptide) pyrophosphoryl-undecaprenol N-acetylglucosamine transferase|nr:undecaprenyldiphospho-muramoylpentapeptide beta-N-acetylglucosaminyltransferase [Tannerellaceae bacterium]